MTAGARLELRHVYKSFGGVAALVDVSLCIEPGTCHALVGENGAGKSTLGKIFAGIHAADAGELRIDDAPKRLASPADAAAAGIGMVHQELAFCTELSVAENLALGRYPRSGPFIDRAAMRTRARTLLARLGVAFDVDQPLRNLSTGQEQLVQIAAALDVGGRVLIFDEPTASLSQVEVRHLFTVVDELRAQRVTMIYVSHRLAEVFRLCDTITVLRDGHLVETTATKATTEDRLIAAMMGRPFDPHHRREIAGASEPIRPDRAPALAKSPPRAARLALRQFASPRRFGPIDLQLATGEICGLAGLVGAGRSDLGQAIFGLDPNVTGTLELDGARLPTGKIQSAMRAGLALVPEDRKRQGLVLPMGCRENFTLASLSDWHRHGFVDRRHERAQAQRAFERLDLRAAHRAPSRLDVPVENLSGGNQQKVVLARWLARNAKVLIADEPTRGVDVGAKRTIHELLNDLAANGTSVLLISSDLPELLQLSHRILVMRDGRLVAEFDGRVDQERVLAAMTGVAC